MSFIDNLALTLKGCCKIALQSRRCHVPHVPGGRIIIMANGPSLADTIANHGDFLMSAPTMAVNFAAITPEFSQLRPQYYVLADPHFFSEGTEDENLRRLRKNLAEASWPLTLFVPAQYRKAARRLYGDKISTATFNAVGVEGFEWFTRAAFASGAAMPRPRNVLIPSIMIAIAMGYTEIVIVGADHSWTRTLSVTDDNEVVSVQPHFYSESPSEKERIQHVYSNIRLHQVVDSFAVAFRAYHEIANYAGRRGVKIINATPGSFIDAFPRSTPGKLFNE